MPAGMTEENEKVLPHLQKNCRLKSRFFLNLALLKLNVQEQLY